MEDPHLYTKKEEIEDISIGKPHIVILGAGASMAAFPKGEKNGKKLPSMNDLFDVVELKPVLDKYGIEYVDGTNFEEFYSDLSGDETHQTVLAEVNQKIFDYFDSLELPDSPTIYDYLTLSLRPKDFIATFNWDPFLYEAIERNHRILPIPKYAFLHGSVSVGYCENCKIKNGRGHVCSKCGKSYDGMPLLYPIKEKDYSSDPLIAGEWKDLANGLGLAFMVTIFGYSAPISDVAAVEAIKTAWGDPKKRQFEQIELINIGEESRVTESWDHLLSPYYHYFYRQNFFDSFIAEHPRRTCEALYANTIMAKFAETNPVPRENDLSLEELQGWFKDLASKES